MIRGLIVICDEWTTRHSFYPIENCEIEKLKNWLKSLKDRVQPQPKQEWSEEDEEILNTIINHFKIDIECTDEDDIIKWLKSLKERYNWKPSDEQIKALETALYTNMSRNDERYSVLSEFIAELKKLMEE